MSWPSFNMQWTNMLSAGQWALLAAIPPVIIALYFLKLRRRPVVVPSTYLWLRAIEDLHVNSLWQRLRGSLLLLLQLLLVGSLMLAAVNPSWREDRTVGDRSIVLIDNSASMGATDVRPTRLDEAKRRALELVDRMGSGDKAMVISFADGAQVVQSFTNNRQELRRAITAVRQSDATTSLDEALRMAGGLANPGRSAAEARDEQVAEAMPATLYILSDGRFPEITDFSLGNLEPIFIPIGTDEAANVAITALGLQPKPAQRELRQLFARVENFGLGPVAAQVSLYLDNELLDVSNVELDARAATGVVFELGDIKTGVLDVRVEPPAESDQLAVDNRAWAVINAPRKVQVLIVTPGLRPLELALSIERAEQLADVEILKPEALAGEKYQARAAAGLYDLVIYDRCAPPTLPQAHTWFIGRVPADGRWRAKEEVTAPRIVDADMAHPILHLVNLNDVLVAAASALELPPGGRTLIDSQAGPLLAIAPREGFEDLVQGFELVTGDSVNSNWPITRSFPVFVLNLLEHCGARPDLLTAGSVRPGHTVTWHTAAATDRVEVIAPGGEKTTVPRSGPQSFAFARTQHTGVYEVRAEANLLGRFAVNLVDAAESNLAVRPESEIRIGHVKVAGQRTWEAARRELWKWLVLGALAILLGEWYIFHRRVLI